MGTTTKLTFEEFEALPEREGTHYELDEGELLMEASPAVRHNLVRQRIAMELMQFVESSHLGIVLEEMDFRLAPDTVRNPDVAFVTAEHLKKIDLDRSPVDGAPALAVEVALDRVGVDARCGHPRPEPVEGQDHGGEKDALPELGNAPCVGEP